MRKKEKQLDDRIYALTPSVVILILMSRNGVEDKSSVDFAGQHTTKSSWLMCRPLFALIVTVVARTTGSRRTVLGDLKMAAFGVK